jgi:hypothetical protein
MNDGLAGDCKFGIYTMIYIPVVSEVTICYGEKSNYPNLMV